MVNRAAEPYPITVSSLIAFSQSSSTKMSCFVSSTCSLVPFDSSLTRPSRSSKLGSSVSWQSSFPRLSIEIGPVISSPIVKKESFVQAAWTRRSRGEAAKRPNRKSWKQRTDMYMRPFLLNVFFSRKFIHAKVMHRPTSKVISVATTNARDIRTNIPSLVDNEACRLIGKLIAERSKEADVYAVSYEPRKGERIEGKLGIVIDTIKEHGIVFVP